MRDPELDIVYRATIVLPNGNKFISTFISQEDCDEPSDQIDILDYIYNRYFTMQPDLSMYEIEKLYTVKVYAQILMLAGRALERAEAYPN
jgi:hypothetical protein